MYSLHEPEGGLILEMLLRLLTPHNLLLLLANNSYSSHTFDRAQMLFKPADVVI